MVDDKTYYVYALKDPRKSPAMPFYIGKGSGARAYEHLARPDDTRKGKRIKEILTSGGKVIVTRLVNDLTEMESLRLEAELIAAFGTEEMGGWLTNSIVPSNQGRRSKREVILPQGSLERAQLGVSLLKQAVLEFAQANSAGVTNAEVASQLGLRSEYAGGSKDYLSYSVLGLLLREGKLQKAKGTRRHIATVE